METFGAQPHKRSEALHSRSLTTADLSRLDKQERDRLISQTGHEVLEGLRDSGAIEYKNVHEMYMALRGEVMIVRRESPERVLELAIDRDPIQITFPEGQRYSNAVEWKPELGSRGLENTFLEGYGQINGIVTVLGFKHGSLDVESLPDASQRFANLDREYVRSIQGIIRPEDVLFVTVRIPAFAYPESDMTEAELDRYEEYKNAVRSGLPVNPLFIQRGYLFAKHMQKH